MRGEVMEVRRRGDGDDDGDDFPSPEAKATSRLALPEKSRGWRRLRDVDWKVDFCSEVSASGEYIAAKVGHQGVWDPPRRAGGATRSWAVLGTLLAAPWMPYGPPLAWWKLPER